MLISDYKIVEGLIRPKKIKNIYYFKPITGFSIDSRSIKKGQAFIALKGKYRDGCDFIQEAISKGASLIISEKEIPIKKVPYFLVEDVFLALKKIILYIRKKTNLNVISVTGSVGKTTTKDMISFLLEENFRVLKNQKSENNLFGVAKTFFSLNNEDILVMELGTNRRGEIKELAEIIYPDIGVITFVKPVHLEGLGSLKGIFEEKTSLLKVNQKIKAILNRDDIYLRRVNFCKDIYWFGKNKNSNLYARLLKRNRQDCKFLIQDKFLLSLATPFDGFIYNALASILVASLFGIQIKDLVEKMNKFMDFPASRMQLEKRNGFLIFNDAYNANPYSFGEALGVLKNFKEKKIIIIGDMLELGKYSLYYHRLLAYKISKLDFEYCCGIGDYIKYTIDELKRLGFKNAIRFSSHSEIVEFIKNKAKKGWIIFLKGSRAMELEKIIDLLKES